MDKNNLKSLISMGYRELEKDKWGKPVGFNFLTLELNSDAFQITNWFKGTNGEMLVWDSENYKYDNNILDNIKGFEASTRYETRNISSFEFITIKEHYEFEL